MKKFVLVAATIAGFAVGGTALADAAAGKAKFDAVCADCHEASEFAGKPVADLEKTLQGIANGSVKHKGKVKISDADAKSLAAFLSAAK